VAPGLRARGRGSGGAQVESRGRIGAVKVQGLRPEDDAPPAGHARDAAVGAEEEDGLLGFVRQRGAAGAKAAAAVAAERAKAVKAAAAVAVVVAAAAAKGGDGDGALLIFVVGKVRWS